MQPYFFPYIGYFQLINAVDFYHKMRKILGS
ncbi:MAG TPA: WbqC family protein, partial [Deltaproteobacteria bacterium]|nr:WbqC family protein [Deltaproteobacteria bacterium]